MGHRTYGRETTLPACSQVCVPNAKSCHLMRAHYMSRAVLEPLSVQTLMALIARDYPRVTDDDTDSERFHD